MNDRMRRVFERESVYLYDFIRERERDIVRERQRNSTRE